MFCWNLVSSTRRLHFKWFRHYKKNRFIYIVLGRAEYLFILNKTVRKIYYFCLRQRSPQTTYQSIAFKYLETLFIIVYRGPGFPIARFRNEIKADVEKVRRMDNTKVVILGDFNTCRSTGTDFLEEHLNALLRGHISARVLTRTRAEGEASDILAPFAGISYVVFGSWNLGKPLSSPT